MQAVFYGVGAAIIGIIAWSAYRLTRKTMGRDPLLWIILVGMAAVTAITETERIELFPLAGLAVWAHGAHTSGGTPDPEQLRSSHSPCFGPVNGSASSTFGRDLLVLLQGRSVCLRHGPCHRSIPLRWRRSQRIRLLDVSNSSTPSPWP